LAFRTGKISHATAISRNILAIGVEPIIFKKNLSIATYSEFRYVSLRNIYVVYIFPGEKMVYYKCYAITVSGYNRPIKIIITFIAICSVQSILLKNINTNQL
jgi:hypothetical protein